jgi:hypothetical protein
LNLQKEHCSAFERKIDLEMVMPMWLRAVPAEALPNALYYFDAAIAVGTLAGRRAPRQLHSRSQQPYAVVAMHLFRV